MCIHINAQEEKLAKSQDIVEGLCMGAGAEFHFGVTHTAGWQMGNIHQECFCMFALFLPEGDCNNNKFVSHDKNSDTVKIKHFRKNKSSDELRANFQKRTFCICLKKQSMGTNLSIFSLLHINYFMLTVQVYTFSP